MVTFENTAWQVSSVLWLVTAKPMQTSVFIGMFVGRAPATDGHVVPSRDCHVLPSREWEAVKLPRESLSSFTHHGEVMPPVVLRGCCHHSYCSGSEKLHHSQV